VPRALLDGVVVGLVLMAVFTTAWSANTLGTWPGAVGTAITAAGVATSAWFVVTAVRLGRTRRRASAEVTADDERRLRRSGRAFGFVFALEGVVIVAAANALTAVGRPDLVLPVIALVVGLHFYPMARIFERRIDTWLATALTAVGLAGTAALLLTDASRDTVWGLVACGAALTTASYGAFFTRLAHDLPLRAGG